MSCATTVPKTCFPQPGEIKSPDYFWGKTLDQSLSYLLFILLIYDEAGVFSHASLTLETPTNFITSWNSSSQLLNKQSQPSLVFCIIVGVLKPTSSTQGVKTLKSPKVPKGLLESSFNLKWCFWTVREQNCVALKNHSGRDGILYTVEFKNIPKLSRTFSGLLYMCVCVCACVWECVDFETRPSYMEQLHRMLLWPNECFSSGFLFTGENMMQSLTRHYSCFCRKQLCSHFVQH